MVQSLSQLTINAYLCAENNYSNHENYINRHTYILT